MQEKIRKFRIFQNSSIEIHSKSSGNVSVLFESSPFGDNWFRKENNRLAEQPQPFSRGEGGPPERSEEKAGRKWNAGDNVMGGTGKGLLKGYVFPSPFLRTESYVSARIPLPPLRGT